MTKKIKPSLLTLTRCIAWTGDFDLDKMICLDDKGKPYLPGKRICGNNDCIELEHIQSKDTFEWKNLEAERNDRSYLNGRKLDWEGLQAELKREKEFTHTTEGNTK